MYVNRSGFAAIALMLANNMAYAQNAAKEPIIAGNPALPMKWVGLLVIPIDVENKKVLKCTAQFISPTVILTAAHCIRDNKTGESYDTDNMYFLLQYQNGDYSERYRPVCAARLESWVPVKTPNQSEDEKARALDNAWQFDFAMILLDHESTTGYFKWKSDWEGQYGTAAKIGYPGAIAAAEIIQRDPGYLGILLSKPNEVMLLHTNPKMTQGTSGGAWVTGYSTT